MKTQINYFEGFVWFMIILVVAVMLILSAKSEPGEPNQLPTPSVEEMPTYPDIDGKG